MPRTKHIPIPNQQGGFALVIALTLMSFVLLLLLSVVTLTRVEQQSSQVTLRQLHAEQNALLGLMIAVGHLQVAAGPDQRVTAQADILTADASEAPDPARRHWTGVWNTDADHPLYAYGELITWLVSGNAAPETAHQQPLSGTNEVSLVDLGSVSDGQEIKLSLNSIQGSRNSGDYAYWIGDEGVKARYNLAAETPPTAAGYNVDGVAPPSLGISFLPHLGNAGSAALSPLIAKVRRTQDLPFLHETVTDEVQRSYFYTLSFHSAGVLSNTAQGGLKYDLTTAFEDPTETLPDLGADLPNLELFRSYYNLKDDVTEENGRFSILPKVQTDTQHEVKPSVIFFQANFGALPTDSAGQPIHAPSPVPKPSNLLFTMRPTLIIANPYNVDLEPADYEFIWEPEPGANDIVYVVRFGTGTQHNLAPLDLLGGSLRLVIENEGFQAGEVKIFTLDADGLQYSATSGAKMINTDGNIGNFLWVDAGVEIPDDAFHDVEGVSMLDWDTNFSQGLNAIVKPNTNVSELPVGHTRFTWRVDGQDATVHENVFNGRRSSLGRHIGGGVHAIKFREALEFGYHARFTLQPYRQGRNNFPDNGNIGSPGGDDRGMAWLANANIRSPRTTQLENTFPDYDWNTHPVFAWLGEVTGWYGGNPMDSVWTLYSDLSGTRGNWGSGIPGGDSGQHFVPLFHVPRSPVLSLGQLKHVNASPEYSGSYSIGSSWANMFVPFDAQDFSHRLNEVVWDTFFFSGFVDNDYLNSRIRPLTELTQPAEPDQIASNLILEGAFNVNSTHEASWQALLSSLRNEELIIFDVNEDSSPLRTLTDLENPIPSSRIPSGDSMEESLGSIDEQLHAQWSGFRNLSDEHITSLAREIVLEIRKRGPFLSLADFVNRDLTNNATEVTAPRMMGALQSAIERAVDSANRRINHRIPQELNRIMGDEVDFSNPYTNSLPNDSAVEGLSVDRDAPGYLTQSDLLSMIGNTISVRSDTFKVRASGGWIHPTSGERVSATCEAIVQRLPQPVTPDPDLTTEPTPDTEKRLGRRFEIVSFRWLSSDEI